MKKCSIALCAGIFILSACGNNEEATESENNVESGDQDQDEKAVDILRQAIEVHEDMDSAYRELSIDTGSDEEGFIEKEWVFIDGEDVYTRSETGEEDNISYTFTDLEDPKYYIHYQDGDEEAIRYEPASVANSDEVWFRMNVGQYEDMIEDSALSYIGEENVNDFSAYALESEEEEATSQLWFDEETYFEVRSDAEADVDIEGGDNNEGLEEGFELNTTEEVLDYEVNPEMDDELFTVPDDMEVVDGDLEDIEVE